MSSTADMNYLYHILLFFLSIKIKYLVVKDGQCPPVFLVSYGNHLVPAGSEFASIRSDRLKAFYNQQMTYYEKNYDRRIRLENVA